MCVCLVRVLGSRGSVNKKDGAEISFGVHLQGQRERCVKERSTGDIILERDVLATAPHQEEAEVLRGFDVEHGQELEFPVGELPSKTPLWSVLRGPRFHDWGRGARVDCERARLRPAAGRFRPLPA